MQTVHDILELLYFAAGVALAVVATIGLRQLTIAKNTAQMSALRESFKLAAGQCLFFLHDVVPVLNALDVAIKQNNVDFLGKSRVQVSGDNIRLLTKPSSEFKEQFNLIAHETAAALNVLEGFSVFFISGVASEEVAFASVGDSFCDSVRKLLPIILVVENGVNYQSILKLFKIWNARLESKNLEMTKAAIEERLNRIDVRPPVKPLGT
jgi:hypothetical protein